jgi:hypothetical protein
MVGSGMAGKYLGMDVTGVDWNAWNPGSPASLVANGGLKNLLDEADTTIRGLTDSMLNRLGNILASGLQEGLSPKAIAKNMMELGFTEARANVVSRTESARAMTMASMASYRATGITEIQWHSNDGACVPCVNNDTNSPYPIEGVPPYPAHPNERCQLIPFFDFS